MADTYVRWVKQVLQQPVWQQDAGEAWIGWAALLFDDIGEGIRLATRAPWLKEPALSQDALDALGDEMSLPKYPRETLAAYQARLDRAWEIWSRAGHESEILAQLEAAGFPGAQIYHASDWPLSGEPNWWSQFWVFFPAGTHTVTGPGAAYGSFNWGDGTTYGPQGISTEDLRTMHAIIKKFRPARWICRAVIFELSGWTYGVGHAWGEPGLVWGGEITSSGVP
jgi:hypothetical protein